MDTQPAESVLVEEMKLKKKVLDLQEEVIKLQEENSILKDQVANTQDLHKELKDIKEENEVLKQKIVTLLRSQEEKDEEKWGTQVDSPAVKKRKLQPPSMTSESSDLEVDNLHALLVPEVLRVLMSYLNPGDLLNSRLVCKTWKDTAAKRFQEDLTYFIPAGQLNKTREFIRCAGVSFPNFSKLRLELSRNGWKDNEYDIKRMFRKCGSKLRKLSLFFTWTWKIVDDLEFRREWNSMINSISGLLFELQINELVLEILCCKRMHKLQEYGRVYFSHLLPHQHLQYLNLITHVLPSVKKLDLILRDDNCLLSHYNVFTFVHMFSFLPSLNEFILRSDRICPRDNEFVIIINALILDDDIRRNLRKLSVHVEVKKDFIIKIINSGLKLDKLHLQEYKRFSLDLSTDPNIRNTIVHRSYTWATDPVEELRRSHLENELNKSNVETCLGLLKIFLEKLEERENNV